MLFKSFRCRGEHADRSALSCAWAHSRSEVRFQLLSRFCLFKLGFRYSRILLAVMRATSLGDPARPSAPLPSWRLIIKLLLCLLMATADSTTAAAQPPPPANAAPVAIATAPATPSPPTSPSPLLLRRPIQVRRVLPHSSAPRCR